MKNFLIIKKYSKLDIKESNNNEIEQLNLISEKQLNTKMDIKEDKFDNADIISLKSLLTLDKLDPKDLPMIQNNIESLTHYTLVVNNKQLYESTIKFYITLGFNVDNLQSKYNLKHEFDATTWEDEHYTKTHVEYNEEDHILFDEETWLSLQNENGKIVLRIVENLHKDFAVADFSQTSDEKLHQLLKEHASVENAFMTFTANIDEIESKFKEMNQPFKLIKSPILNTNEIYKQIYTYDPLLNLLEFHDKSKYDKLMNINESSERSKKKNTNKKQKPEKKIAIMTSGKETSGMNAAIRALVRCGLTESIVPYIVFNGFKGKIFKVYLIFYFSHLKRHKKKKCYYEFIY